MVSWLDLVMKTITTKEDCPLNEDEACNILKAIPIMRKEIARQGKIQYILLAAIFLYVPFTSSQDSIISKEMVQKIKEVNVAYCNEDNKEVRKVLLKYARENIPFYPEGGLCESERQINQFFKVFQHR